MRKVEQSTEKQTAVGADSQVEQTTEKVGKNQKKKHKKRKKMEELELTKDQVQAKNDELQLAIDELEAELAARDRADSDDNAVMNAKLVATTESLDAATKNLNASESACDEKDLTIGMLQRDVATTNAKLVATTESLDAATKKLNASESACDEKDLTIGMLQRDVAATNDKLVATTESLKELESSKTLVVTQLAKRNVELERLLEQTTQSNQVKLERIARPEAQLVVSQNDEKVAQLKASNDEIGLIRVET